MKRSEWIQEIAREASMRSALPVRTELFIPAATMAADALTAAGMKWDPEELPKAIKATKVVDCDGYHLLPLTPGEPMSEEYQRRLYEAAAEAYNEIGGLRERLQKATEAERLSLEERRVIEAEILLWKQKYESLFERAELTRQRADRFQDVVRRAIEYMETKALSPTWARDLLAILKEEKA